MGLPVGAGVRIALPTDSAPDPSMPSGARVPGHLRRKEEPVKGGLCPEETTVQSASDSTRV